MFPTEQHRSSGESQAQAVTPASNAAATHSPEPLVTHNGPAGQGPSRPAEHLHPHLPVCLKRQGTNRPGDGSLGHTLQPSPEKIQGNQWQKQPVALRTYSKELPL